MDFNLDNAIEQFSALKLQAPPPPAQQLAAMQAQCQQAMDHVRAECAQAMENVRQDAARKEREMEQAAERMQAQMREMTRRIETMEHRNRLLQSNAGTADTYKHLVNDQQLVIDGLREQVEHLKQTNAQLRYVVEQNDRSMETNQFLPPRPPPDVY